MTYAEVTGAKSVGVWLTDAFSGRRVWGTLATVLVFLVPIAVAIWMGKAFGVAAGAANAFAWHPLFMSIGFGFFMGNAAIAYSGACDCVGTTRPSRRWLHGLLQFCAMASIAVGFAGVIVGNQPSVIAGDDDTAGGKHDFLTGGKPTIVRAHIVIGIVLGALVFITSAFGVIKLGLKSAGLQDSAVLPGAWLHGWFGQLIWIGGIINMCLAITFAEAFQTKEGKPDVGAQAGLITLLSVLIISALVLIHKVVDGGVVASSADDAHAHHDDGDKAHHHHLGESINAGIDYGRVDA